MNDIMSELERAIEEGCGEYREVEVRVLKYARALLCEQHARIEMLQEDIVAASRLIEEQMEASAKRHKSIMRDLAQVKRDLPLALANIRSKAITEFAERVNKETIIIKDHRGNMGAVVRSCDIDQIAMEMKEVVT